MSADADSTGPVGPAPRRGAGRIGSGTRWEAVVGYSRVVVVGDQVWVSGTTGTVDGVVAAPGDAAAQTRQAIENVAAALHQVGAGLGDVVRTRLYVTDIGRWEEVGRVHGEFFAGIRPASTMLEVSALVDPAMLVEIEVDAVLGAAAALGPAGGPA